MMQMSIKTMELQKASLEAMRGAAAGRREGQPVSIVLYYGSGSPFAWRVQLRSSTGAAYERRVLSFSAGDTRKPEFLALNPRHRVPVIVDGDFVLYESNAIVEYLDEAYPGRGAPLFPGDARRRALIRRLILEADNYLEKAIDPIVEYAFREGAGDARCAEFADGKAAVAEECALFARSLAGEFLAGPLSAADYALYPMVAFLDRCRVKLPDFDPLALMPAPFAAWKARGGGASLFRCDDPTALAEEGLTMKLSTTAFADHGIIPGEFAFAVIDPATHVRLSANRNPTSRGPNCRTARARSRSSATIPTCRRAATT